MTKKATKVLIIVARILQLFTRVKCYRDNESDRNDRKLAMHQKASKSVSKVSNS